MELDTILFLGLLAAIFGWLIFDEVRERRSLHRNHKDKTNTNHSQRTLSA